MKSILGLLCLLFAALVFAAASQGLKWSAVTTYDDGTPIESGQKVVYLVYDDAGKQVGSTFNIALPASALPSDGCYRVKAALYFAAKNSVVPASESLTFSQPACTKAPPPVQRRLSAVADVSIQ